MSHIHFFIGFCRHWVPKTSFWMISEWFCMVLRRGISKHSFGSKHFCIQFGPWSNKWSTFCPKSAVRATPILDVAVNTEPSCCKPPSDCPSPTVNNISKRTAEETLSQNYRLGTNRGTRNRTLELWRHTLSPNCSSFFVGGRISPFLQEHPFGSKP